MVLINGHKNNATTGDNLILEFLTETTLTARGSIKYDRVGDMLNISGTGGGLKFSSNILSSGTLNFAQPVGIGFANGQYIKDNGTGGLFIVSGAAINMTGTTITGNTNFVIHSNGSASIGNSTQIGTLYIAGETTIATNANIRSNGGYMTLQSASGNVGVGMVPNLKLSVFNDGSIITGGTVTFATQAKGIEIYNNQGGTTDNLVGCWFSTGPHKAGIASGRTNAASTWGVDLRFFVHGPEIAQLDQTYEKMRLGDNGTLTVVGDVVAYGSPSDSRLKIIKEKVPNALASVLKLNGYRFDWKETNHLKNYKEDIGVIAQEVAELFPELARTNVDGNMSVRYQGLTAVLIEAIKEQQKQIDNLKKQLV